MGLVASVCQPSTLRMLIRPEASKAQQAGHGLTATRLRDVLRASLTAIRKVDELGRQAKLMRIYALNILSLRPKVAEPIGVRYNRTRVR
jgi:hypothetical protein